MAKEDRGFASMDRAKQREIARKGGKAAHMKGTAHEWTSEEARHGRPQGRHGEPQAPEAAAAAARSLSLLPRSACDLRGSADIIGGSRRS